MGDLKQSIFPHTLKTLSSSPKNEMVDVDMWTCFKTVGTQGKSYTRSTVEASRRTKGVKHETCMQEVYVQMNAEEVKQTDLDYNLAIDR